MRSPEQKIFVTQSLCYLRQLIRQRQKLIDETAERLVSLHAGSKHAAHLRRMCAVWEKQIVDIRQVLKIHWHAE